MTTKISICLLLTFCVFQSVALAQSAESPEAAALNGIAQAMNVYAGMNQGKLPSSWQQLTQFYDLNKVYHDSGEAQAYLEDHYQFITQPLNLPDIGSPFTDGKQVVLIRTVPVQRNTSLGNQYQERLLLFRGADGKIAFTSIHEEDIQVMLKKAGVTITPKAGLPAIETDVRIVPTSPPQPNPNDTEFLLKHPELNPANKQTQTTQPTSDSSPPSRPPAAQTATTQTPLSTETSIPWWIYGLIVFSIATIIGAGYYLSKRGGKGP